MENQTNLSNDQVFIKGKNTHISLNEWLNKMKIAFSNGKQAQFQSLLSSVSYDEAKLDELLEQIKAIEQLAQAQKKEYAAQYEATSKLEEKRNAINETYMKHFALCKILLKNNVKAQAALEFSGNRKSAYSEWYQQVANFYAQLLNTPEFLSDISSINIVEADLTAVQTALEELSTLKEKQKSAMAKAQKSTETRDKAFESLYPLYSDYISYAKVLFSNEQDLEALGITVRRD
ncbi:hypothetical protein [Riemerella columbina]|uniref:hypothetical protein n=1 Tax=Riemerella columbina TaxID=103810 RepID=UPI0026708E29|nr:hypothetical protein [Riemerella columbina]WKS94484.1 hypothetical protein NYR17_05960 [Riemerella columbina]